jgi:hypothetical protein
LLKLLRGAGPGFAGAAAGAPVVTGVTTGFAGAAGMLVAMGEAAQVATQCSCPNTEELSNADVTIQIRMIRMVISPPEFKRFSPAN